VTTLAGLPGSCAPPTGQTRSHDSATQPVWPSALAARCMCRTCRQYDSSGFIHRCCNDDRRDIPDLCSADGTGRAARFNFAQGVAVDVSGAV
jgi:hypothetical protein